ncbi:MAG: bifunctional YncE family protein/alkaline phosphatase family protein [Terriglobia bacterium]
MRPRYFLAIALLVLNGQAAWPQARNPQQIAGSSLSAPAGNRPTKIDPTGETVLPSGRLITPLGKQVKVAPHPYGLVVSPDGKTLVTVNSGTKPFSVSIITGLGESQPQVAQIPPGFDSADADPQSVFLGAAVAPDNHKLYISEGDNGKIGIFDLVTHQRLGGFSLDGSYLGATYKDSLTGAILLTRDGRQLLVLDLGHFRLVVVDTQSKQILSSIPVGRMPFGLALSPDGMRVYVSNVGMFRYSVVPGFDPKNPRTTGLEFPAFGFPSPEAEKGATVEGKQIAGLGDPNVPDSNSVFVIDLHDPAKPNVLAKVRTGIPVGDKSVSGSSPGDVVAGKKEVFVSNSAQDSISILDARTNQIKKTVVLEPAISVKGLRGVLPFGMALSPDEKRLYVACSGINAIAVLDAHKAEVLGYIPTAWFPARVAVSADNRTLYVANGKGFGAGPNGGPNFQEGPEGTYIGDLMKGTVSIIPLDAADQLTDGTFRVMRDNGFLPPSVSTVLAYQDYVKTVRSVSEYRRRHCGCHYHPYWLPVYRLCALCAPMLRLSPPLITEGKIQHIVFIVKENRTFDEMFGDLHPQSPDFAGVPAMARWGETAQVTEKDEPTIEDGHVTPNHHALARRFGISDNYYVEGDVSVDGHHWLVGNYPNEVLETAVPAGYGGHFTFQPDDDAPGRLAIGSTHPFPETYLEAGSLWQHLSRGHISFRNYGEGLEIAGEDEGIGDQPTGVREATNMPMTEALFENTSRDYATFNTNISDQFRFGQFEREFQIRYASGKEPLPQFIFIWLPNDHTADPRPGDGYAYHASYVADNDLALGKLVQLFSHSPFWKDMAIFVTEDDAQSGRDHVDAHRSVLMVVSPYARSGYVSHVHTSMASILKTFDLTFQMGFLNQFDAAATDLSDFFTSQPDFTPYDTLPSDVRIFDPAKVREPGLDMKAQHGAPLDDPDTIRREMRKDDH